MDSVLDEGFFKSHLKLFDGMTLQNGLLMLAHGQVISMHHLSKRKWIHFFNDEKVSSSNYKTKLISKQVGKSVFSDVESSDSGLNEDKDN